MIRHKNSTAVRVRLVAADDMLKKPDWLNESTWRGLVKRDDGSCLACSRKLEIVCSVHHLLPRSCGGDDGLSNLVLLCQSCHDRLEMAQEAMLWWVNRPPSRNQIVGIFEDAMSESDSGLPRQVSPAVKTFHAKRIIFEHRDRPEHLRILRGIAKQRNCWHHVDWSLVESEIYRRGGLA